MEPLRVLLQSCISCEHVRLRQWRVWLRHIRWVGGGDCSCGRRAAPLHQYGSDSKQDAEAGISASEWFSAAAKAVKFTIKRAMLGTLPTVRFDVCSFSFLLPVRNELQKELHEHTAPSSFLLDVCMLPLRPVYFNILVITGS